MPGVGNPEGSIESWEKGTLRSASPIVLLPSRTHALSRPLLTQKQRHMTVEACHRSESKDTERMCILWVFAIAMRSQVTSA